MFEEVKQEERFVEIEEGIERYWKEGEICRKSMEKGEEVYVFYEGPPTANGRPGIHHVSARAYKDLYPRYKTMRGYRVR
ncbi:MAG: class I tRNA ligase family protein, partial [Blastocatellia bacterium]|nr:class I tRNA ligase family protein [Blastocatellia bacterium]